MRQTFLALGLSLALGLAGGAKAMESEVPTNFANCRPEAAWVVPGTDLLPNLRKASLPTLVVQRLAGIGRDYVTKAGAGWIRGETCDNLYGAIYRYAIKGNRQLFGIRLLNLSNWGEYQYFLYDSGLGTVSPGNLRLILSDWGDQDPRKRESAPVVSVADLYRNGRPQIVILEHKRNGTNYNADIFHYLDVGRDLSLVRVFALETNSLKADYGPGDTMSWYKRSLSILGGNRLRVDTELGPIDEPGPERPLGYAIFTSEGAGIPFRVLSCYPRNADDDWALVEVSRRVMTDDHDDDRFLREGCPEC